MVTIKSEKNTAAPRTAFRARYKQFKYIFFTLFAVTGASEWFQPLANDIFRSNLDKCVLEHPDDILIQSNTKIEHFEHLEMVLQKLKEKIYGKILQSEFFESHI